MYFGYRSHHELKEATVAHSNRKYEHNTRQLFGQQNPQYIIAWKLNGNIFFELFLSDLDEKMTSAGYERNTKGNSENKVILPMCIYLAVFPMQSENTA